MGGLNMVEARKTPETCPFCAILSGREPGKIIYQDEAKAFALIQSLHPESAIHWLAIPFEHVNSIEDLEQHNSERFLALVEFAMTQTKAQTADFAELQNGFTLKFHVGSFETVPHAKLHILSTE
jgi:histidine triad (HIT) family protein